VTEDRYEDAAALCRCVDLRAAKVDGGRIGWARDEEDHVLGNVDFLEVWLYSAGSDDMSERDATVVCEVVLPLSYNVSPVGKRMA
jgi:hypothetical protein